MLVRVLLLTLLFLTCNQLFADDKPNVLLILTDDQGWGDLAINGNAVIQTPNIDQLAKQGVSFERFYVSPVCSPTRASLLTGRHSLATGVFSVTRGGEKMPSHEVTLAEALKSHGYNTGLFGKWHNGLQYPYNPMGQGFDTFYGFADGHTTRYYDSVVQHNHTFEPYQGYLPDILTEKAIAFISQSDAPFFAYLSYNTPHSPFVLPDEYFQKYKAMGESDLNASIFGMVENIDWNIGRVLNHLKRTEQLDNTIVMFLSDNGPAFPHGHHRYNGDMKGWKGKVDEGGVRVPFIVSWPKKIQGGNKIAQPAQHIDVLPTLTALTGTPEEVLTNPLHGIDLSPLLLNASSRSGTAQSSLSPIQRQAYEQRTLYTHHFRNTTRPHQKAIQAGPAAVRSGDWLATLDHHHVWQLYNLKQDPSQKKDLAQKQPEKVAQLSKSYMQWFEHLTRTYGDYRPLPIELGHEIAPITQLPAHEASITQEGIDYFHKAGWSHDWLTSLPPEQSNERALVGAAQWPIRVTQTAAYHWELLYSTTEQGYKGTFELQLINESTQVMTTLKLSKLTPHVAPQLDSHRRYETGEAPERVWANALLGAPKLEKGRYTARIQYKSDANHQPLFIKGLTVKLKTRTQSSPLIK